MRPDEKFIVSGYSRDVQHKCYCFNCLKFRLQDNGNTIRRFPFGLKAAGRSPSIP